MGIETESYENLGKRLEEELRSGNLNLHAPEEVLKFELVFRPRTVPMLIRLFITFFAWILFALLVFIFLSRLFDEILVEGYLKRYLEQLVPYLNIFLISVSVFLGLKFFGGRLLDLIRAYFLLLNTEYVICDFFVLLKTGFGSRRARIVPYSTVRSLVIREGWLDRFFGVGDLVLLTDSGKVYLHSVLKPKEIADKILELIKEVS
jgi:hypothetical protein